MCRLHDPVSLTFNNVFRSLFSESYHGGHRLLFLSRPSFKLSPPVGSPKSSLSLRLGLEPPRCLNASNYFSYVPLALPDISVPVGHSFIAGYPGRGGASFLPTYRRLSLGEHCIDLNSCPCTAPDFSSKEKGDWSTVDAQFPPVRIPRIQDNAFVKIMSLGMFLYTIVTEPLERGCKPFMSTRAA